MGYPLSIPSHLTPPSCSCWVDRRGARYSQCVPWMTSSEKGQWHTYWVPRGPPVVGQYLKLILSPLPTTLLTVFYSSPFLSLVPCLFFGLLAFFHLASCLPTLPSFLSVSPFLVTYPHYIPFYQCNSSLRCATGMGQVVMWGGV